MSNIAYITSDGALDKLLEKAKGEKKQMTMKGLILFILLFSIEVLLVQWLFGKFGFEFDFLDAFLILCVIDFLLGRSRK